jgi:hypothetical protein
MTNGLRKKAWQKPEIKVLKAGSAEVTPVKTGNPVDTAGHTS